MNRDLLRQRRNLLIISGLLIIFDFAQVTIAKVSLLGTELIIGRPEVLVSVVWFLWAYFFLRYYQFLEEENDLKIRSTFNRYFNCLAVNYAQKKAIAKGSKRVFNNLNVSQEGIKCLVINSTYVASEGNVLEDVVGPLPLRYVFWWYIKSSFYLVAKTSKVTDHVIPIVFVISALIINILSNFGINLY